MLEKLAGIEKHYKELNDELMQIGDDYIRAAAIGKERAEIEPIVQKAEEYREILSSIKEARSILESGTDPDFVELAEMEIAELEPQVEPLENEIKLLLVPKDPRDNKNVIMEVRAGTGGDEAALFAADLYRMYTRYAENQKWKTEIMSQSNIGIGGVKEITFLIKGDGAYSKLKFESGVHRVQRVPSTESQGRIHTSTATVAVLAEVEEVDIKIPATDLRIDVYKSAGAGGQSVQKNSTAIRITHEPSGLVVACQDERSQLQNKLRAMAILRARLYEAEEEKRRSKREADRRSQVGTGERSEKIRTYNYPQSRVTDHRINHSSYNLQGMMEGDIAEFIEELITRDEADRLAAVNE
ncbi:MAG: peptide chain release factor 1 [Anaerolineae bacterium]|jgi:peptide chain release factor 1|nr:peptide chain release factor 1 [Anaerolineae bacterium]MBT7073300.1 peptide chain release factor 1 [Anaerolineae bacterium]MBT7781431.1 peptide chain release factor 1 [Anaerolineae bacterium]